MSWISRSFRLLAGSLLVFACIGSFIGQAMAEDGASRKSELVLSVPDAVATTEADMKAYSDPLEHTDLSVAMVPIPG